jgi:hypothetical protein
MKFTVSGYHNDIDGLLLGTGSQGYYWGSSVSGIYSILHSFYVGGLLNGINDNRATGFAVRCIKD